jgi:hypothetical protein
VQTLPLSAALEGVRNRFDDSAHLARPLVVFLGGLRNGSGSLAILAAILLSRVSHH